MKTTVLTGWLNKQGQHIKTWKCRYFELHDVELIYRTGPQEEIKGSGVVSRVDLWSGHEHGIVFYLQGGRKIYSYADSLAEQRKWYQSVEPQTPEIDATETVDRFSLASIINEGGWLHKQGRKRKNWKKRYFALSGCVLSYRVDKNPLARVKGIGRVLDVKVSTSQTFGLDIEMEQNRILHVYADTYMEQNQWYVALKTALCSPMPRLSVQATTTPYSPSTLSYAGYLMKQDRTFIWTKRYFELRSRTLSYHNAEGLPALFCDTIASMENWKGKRHGLKIKFEKGKVLYVQASCANEFKSWCTAISNNL